MSTASLNAYTDTTFDHTTKLKAINSVCPICKQPYIHPRVLNCLHSLCEECIINNLFTKHCNAKVTKTFTKCIICLELTEIPEDISMLPYNFFVNNAIDYMLIQCSNTLSIICTSCSDEVEAISHCNDCSEFLCIKCITAHKRIKMTKEHKIIPLDVLRYDKTTIHRPVYCPDHDPETFIYYCEVCKDLICKECTILEHRGHKFEKLEDALQAQKPEIMKLIKENEKEKIPPVDKAIDEVQDMAARLHARTIATKQAIKKCAEHCIREIEHRCNELLSNIDELYKQKIHVLHEQQKDLQLRITRNKTATDFIDYAFQNGSEAEIFELIDVMKMRLINLNSEPLNYHEPNENDVIDYIHDKEAIKNIAENLGHIKTSTIFLSFTQLSGPGLYSGKVGIETYFIVKVFDRNGTPCNEYNNDDSIRAKIQAPENFYINNKVHNNEDGTYTIRYIPVTVGKHEITVKIRGRNFPNNHYIVKVFDGIDYHKIDSLFLKFGTFGSKPSELKQPWGVAVSQDGHMYISDHGNHRVQVFDRFGVFIIEFGSKGSKDGQFSGPTGIAIDKNGIVYVADWENHRIQMFRMDGTFSGKFGTKGSGFGQVYHPAGIAIDNSNNIVVAERDNHRLQVFTPDGKPVLLIGSHGKAPGLLNSPTHLAITEDNNYVVSDAGNNRVVFLDNNGTYLKEKGLKGNGPGEFNRPSGVAVDKEGYVIIGDFHNHRVNILTQNLDYFTEFGSEGKEDLQFKHPSGLCLTLDGRIVIVDRYNHRVQIV